MVWLATAREAAASVASSLYVFFFGRTVCQSVGLMAGDIGADRVLFWLKFWDVMMRGKELLLAKGRDLAAALVSTSPSDRSIGARR